jgi:alkylated DNA repair dioxygenase AlkB
MLLDYLLCWGPAVITMMSQENLFEDDPTSLPDGFNYRAGVLSGAEETALVEEFRTLPFKEFEFHGFLGKRRVVSFGWRYDFNDGGLKRTEPIPDFLMPVRDKAAAFAGLQSSELEQVLLTEYQPGAAIGWHKDRAIFGEVVGISLLSPCVFRFRRKNGPKWDRASLDLEPRSAYVLKGPARTQWEHSIPAVKRLRYSITFRNFKIA